MTMNKPTISYRIDTRWCLDELLKDGRISQRDANLVATTPRTRDKLHWHPLQMIAQFDMADQKNVDAKLNIDVLTAWLAAKAGQPLFHIDPLKINAGLITGVMSYAFAERHGILAVQVNKDDVVIASAQPFHNEWEENLKHTLKGKTISRVVVNPAQLHRYSIEFYKLARAIEGAHASDAVSSNTNKVGNFEQLLDIGNIQNPDANDQHIVNIVDWLLQYAFDHPLILDPNVFPDLTPSIFPQISFLTF